MADLLLYKIDEYKEEYKKIFAGLYNDFKMKAMSRYKFELEPLEYEDFVNSISSGLLKCLILFEENFPTAFLVYTTVISESIELNIIHSVSDESRNNKMMVLLEKFLEMTLEERKTKPVTYPLTGIQADFYPFLTDYGFKCVNQSVMKFDFSDEESVSKIRNLRLPPLPEGYEIRTSCDFSGKNTVSLILEAFNNSSDALFDVRFKSRSGVKDIIFKIVGEIYGEFLPECTSALFRKNELIGLCFVNLTNSKIANIPILAVANKYKNQGFGTLLLKNSLVEVYSSVMNGKRALKELNATCDRDFLPAYKAYLSVGFKEDEFYKLAYKPKISS